MQNLINIISRLVSKHFAKEQSGYPNEWAGWSEFIAEMQSEGFTRLGNGYFSAAFSHVSNTQRIIKIGFKKEDSGAAYAAYCRMNQGKVGIPNVYDIQRHDNCYTVVMDWLQPFERNYGRDRKANDDMFQTISAYIEGGYDGRDDMDYSQYAATLEQAEALCAEAEALFQTTHGIREFFNGIASFDCHSGNVMVNAEGKLVITDPVSFTRGIEGWDALSPTDLKAGRDEAMRKKFKERHEANRKTLRIEARKARRKAAKERYARRARFQAEREVKEKDFPMACNMHHNGLIGAHTWHRNGCETLGNIARNIREMDMVRVMMNQPLVIDDLMQARLMG